MAKSLSAHDHPLTKVFCSDFEFFIPSYQRPYRWGVEQALQLLEDLAQSLKRNDIDPYFLGSLVLVEKGGTQFDVIDGQQRLTTLTMLFAVLRDLAEDPEAKSELAKLVLEPGSKLKGIASEPRLSLRAEERDFFRSNIQLPGGTSHLLSLSETELTTGSKQAIYDNTKALFDELSDWSESQRNALATLMLTRTFLVVVSTPDLDSAYRIFSVMNARGLDLTPADIFKSQVVGALPDDSDYAQKWQDAEEALGSRNFTDLFREIRTIENGTVSRQELLKEFPAQVLNAYLPDRADEFVDKLLLPYAKAFEQIIDYKSLPQGQWSVVSQWLRRLDAIDNRDWRPAALWALVHHKNDPAFLIKFLTKLERLAMAQLLMGTYSTQRVTRYLELMAQLKRGHGLDAPALHVTDDEKKRCRETLEGPIYQKVYAQRLRSILLRLDEVLRNGPGVEYEHKIITIEHVLPQNPSRDSDWVRLFTQDEREWWTHRLGNLLLLNRRKNSAARNYDFITKKASYFNTKGSAAFALTTQVLDHSTWTPEVIDQRQQLLVNTLLMTWDLK